MAELFNRAYMLHFHSILMKLECLNLLGSFKNPVRITRCINYDWMLSFNISKSQERRTTFCINYKLYLQQPSEVQEGLD